MGKATPMLRCLTEYKVYLFLSKVHVGIYGIHIGERALESKLLRVEYYWTNMLRNNSKFVINVINEKDSQTLSTRLMKNYIKSLHRIPYISGELASGTILVGHEPSHISINGGGLLKHLGRGRSSSKNNTIEGTMFLLKEYNLNVRFTKDHLLRQWDTVWHLILWPTSMNN